MAIWDKLKDGIDKANRVAQDALDEGKGRMDARKARQAADNAAQALGYAIFRSWELGREPDAQVVDRMARALRDHEQEAARLTGQADQSAEWRKRQDGAPEETSADAAAPEAAAPSTSAGEAPPQGEPAA